MKITNKIFLSVIIFFVFLLCNVYGQNKGFNFLVISDVHISSDTSRFVKLKKFVKDINDEVFGKVDFLIITGDNVSSYFEDRNKQNDIFNNRSLKFISILSELKIPHYIVLGNHDYKIDRKKDSDAPFTFNEIDTMETLWKSSASIKPFYSFEHKGWKFIILNSMRGRYLNRFFDDEQLLMLNKQLAENKSTFLFFHHPIQTDNFKIWCKPKDLITKEKEPIFFSILQENKNQIKGIFVGHGHLWNDDVLYNSIKVYETNSFGESEPFSAYLVETTSIDNFKIKRFEKNNYEIIWEQ